MQAPEMDSAPAQGGGASDLVARIGDDLAKLVEMLEGSGAVEGPAIEGFQALGSQYQDLVQTHLLGGGPKAPAPKRSGNPSVPVEAGGADVQPAM